VNAGAKSNAFDGEANGSNDFRCRPFQSLPPHPPPGKIPFWASAEEKGGLPCRLNNVQRLFNGTQRACFCVDLTWATPGYNRGRFWHLLCLQHLYLKVHDGEWIRVTSTSGIRNSGSKSHQISASSHVARHQSPQNLWTVQEKMKEIPSCFLRVWHLQVADLNFQTHWIFELSICSEYCMSDMIVCLFEATDIQMF